MSNVGERPVTGTGAGSDDPVDITKVGGTAVNAAAAGDGALAVELLNPADGTRIPYFANAPVNITQYAGTAANAAQAALGFEPVTLADGNSTTASVTSATTLWTLDTLGYNSVSVQVTSAGTTCTITYEQSEDNSTWVATNGYIATGISPVDAIQTTTAAGLWYFPKKARYFRARVSTYTSGTVTAIGQLSGVMQPDRAIRVTTMGTGTVYLASSYPAGTSTVPGVPLTNSSGNVANASAVATLAGAASKTTYITGFAITGTGATSASVVSVTVAGVISGTMTFTYAAVAGVTLANTPLIVQFTLPIPASATNTAIVVTCPALGTGATNNTANAWGFQL